MELDDDLHKRLLAALEESALLLQQTARLLHGHPLPITRARRQTPERALELARLAEKLAREMRRRLGRSALHGPAGQALTRRELAVVELLVLGLRDKDIATRLGISRRTAESHVSNILRKLGLQSRTQVVSWHLQHHARDASTD